MSLFATTNTNQFRDPDPLDFNRFRKNTCREKQVGKLKNGKETLAEDAKEVMRLMRNRIKMYWAQKYKLNANFYATITLF